MKKIAIIGYGNMGKTHVRNLLTLPDEFEIGSVYDTDPDALRAASQKGLPVASSLQELLDRPDIDICLISVPNKFHRELSVACLAAGKHVICEKPVALNTEELVEILTVARQHDRIFTVDQNRRWDRDFLLIKSCYDRREPDSVIFIDSRVQGSHPLPDNWLSKKEYGGGMLMDWGVHLIDQLLYMIDRPVTQVYAQAVTLPGRECEENVKILLTFSDKETAQIQVDTQCYCRLPRWHVMFENATAVIENIGEAGTLYRPGPASGVEKDEFKIGSGPSRTMTPSEEISAFPLNEAVDSDFVKNFYPNVAAAIDKREKLYVQPDQILRVMKVIDAARNSLEQGFCVRCSI